MATGYRSLQILKPDAGAVTQTLGASTSGTSAPFIIGYQGSLNIRIEVVVDSSTAGAGVSAALQHAPFRDGNNADWATVKSVAVTSVGSRTVFTILCNVEVTADQGFMPLRPHGRVLLTTGAGSAAVISDIRVIQGW